MLKNLQFTRRDILVTGFALLAMFFGAGNLIFPPMLGLQSGDELFWGGLGFIITGVGLPLLGVTAVAFAGGDLEHLANRVNPTFSKIITTISLLCIGPLLAIPRTAATTFEVAIAPNITANNTQLSLLLTTLIFFTIALIFVLRPNKILDSIGKFLTPLMLIFLAVIIYLGVTGPLAEPGPSTYANPFASGFLEGYNTMDAIASVIFGMIIVKGLRSKGIKDNSQIVKITVISGVIAASGLAVIYSGLAYIGASTGTLFPGENHGEMLIFISESFLGSFGRVVIGIVMALACLTTAIGLIASCGEFFSRLSKNRLSYNTVSIITTVVSFALANMGLENILKISVPLLVFVYPIIIALVLLSLLNNLFRGRKIVYVLTVGVTVTFVVLESIYNIGESVGVNLGLIDKMLSMLPFYDLGLGWVVPVALVMSLSMIFLRGETKQA